MDQSYWGFLVRQKTYLAVFVGSAFVLGFITPPPTLFMLFNDAIFVKTLRIEVILTALVLLLALSFGVIHGILRIQYAARKEALLASLILVSSLTAISFGGYFMRAQLAYRTEIVMAQTSNSPPNTNIIAPSPWAVALTIASSLPMVGAVYSLAIGSLAKVDYAKFHYWLDTMFVHVEDLAKAVAEKSPTKSQKSADRFCEALRNAITGVENSLPYEPDDYATYISQVLLVPLKDVEEFTKLPDFKSAPHLLLQLSSFDYENLDRVIQDNTYHQSFQKVSRFVNDPKSRWPWTSRTR